MRTIVMAVLIALGFAVCQAKANESAAHYAHCKIKNGNKHWSQFIPVKSHYARRTRYSNGRLETVQEIVVHRTYKLWRSAEKRGACVIAVPSGYGVTLRADDNVGKTHFVQTH